MTRDLYKLPSTAESVPTPRTKDNLFHTTKLPNIRKPRNFDRALKKLQKTGKLDLEDFNSAADVGAFIDWYNESTKKKRDERAHDDIVEISKLLARILTSKSIVINNKKGGKINT